jgi:2'-5' RNA ligase
MREAMVRAIRKAVRSSGGRAVRAENLHVTLAFLGSVRPGRLPELAAIAREAAGARPGGGPAPEALELAFAHLEYWRAAQLTVVRKVSREGRITSMRPVVWRFSELALIESRTLAEGAAYSVVQSFPLCGGAAKSTGPSKAANNSETR